MRYLLHFRSDVNYNGVNIGMFAIPCIRSLRAMAKHFLPYPMNKIAGVEMSDEKILGIMRDFIKELVTRDLDKVLSFLPRMEIGLTMQVCLKARMN